jgi:hypothetical protein
MVYRLLQNLLKQTFEFQSIAHAAKRQSPSETQGINLCKKFTDAWSLREVSGKPVLN